MPIPDARRRLLWHGLLLVLLALLQGAVIQSFANPRLGLAAHLGGIMNGALIAVIGLAWDDIRLSARAASVLFWATVISGYANWLGLVFAGVFGTSRTTPLLGAGHSGTPWQEALVGFLLTAGAVVILVAFVVALAGLRRRTV